MSNHVILSKELYNKLMEQLNHFASYRDDSEGVLQDILTEAEAAEQASEELVPVRTADLSTVISLAGYEVEYADEEDQQVYAKLVDLTIGE